MSDTTVALPADVDVSQIAQAYRTNTQVNIIIDSCADIAPEVAASLGVEIIAFPFVMDDGEHFDDLWQSMCVEEFYDHMRDGEIVTTSAVTPGYYLEVFKRAAEKAIPTVYLGFTRGLSSSIDAARSAQDMLREQYPDFELYVVDNLCPSAAGALLAIEAVHQAASGMSAAELAAWAEEARYYIHGFFTLQSFDALARGGRIPPAAAQVGSKLDIKPLLSYDLHGALTLHGMCRGRKKALRSMVSAVVEGYEQAAGSNRSMPIGIASSDDMKAAHWLADQLRKEEVLQDVPIIFSSVSPVIGAHVGPEMLAVVFWGADRRETLSFADKLARKLRSKRGNNE